MTLKRKTPTEVIEAEKSHENEHAYVKFPGKRIIPVTLNSGEVDVRGFRERLVTEDIDKIKYLWRKEKRRPYTQIHTHSYSPLPSEGDMNKFLADDSVKSMAIAQVNKNTNKLEGYFYLRKSKDTKQMGYSPIEGEEVVEKLQEGGIIKGLSKILGISLRQRGVIKSTKKYGKKVISAQRNDVLGDLFPLVEKMAEEHKLQYRFVPAEEYVTNKDKIRFVKKPSTLEGKLKVTTVVVGLIGGLFFLSSNITGDVVGNMANYTSNIIGVVLICIGLIGSFFWLRSRRKK